DPRDTEGHVNEVYRDATTPDGLVTAAPGGDKVLVATGGDVIVEGTPEPAVTSGLGDSLGHVSEVSEGATTPGGLVTPTPGGDKVLVATGSDVLVEGTDQPGVTGDPGDTLGHVNEVHEGATTLVGLVTPTPGGDKVLVATASDVIAEGIQEPGVTGDPGDTLGHVNEVYGDATTPVGLVPTPPEGDKVLVATGSDVLVEGTEEPGATGDPGDTLGRVTEVYGDATTPVAAVPTSPGRDKVLVAHGGD
ncbi:PREDICTED: protein PBMUCL2-like, partial [Lepidothrix coronata]|uniref:Protein PBMUCL2-like n=1 Tax=Lepidothrix coronata TaxID=321398 RepID=A0A6J0G7K8_9PASS